jgi:hypothetical protein
MDPAPGGAAEPRLASMGLRGVFATLAAASVICLGAAGVAGGAIPPPTLGPGGCDDPTQGHADFEAYGPTDVNVQAGNGRVTVNENPAGTITVFKYPNPSLFNLVKYFALSRDRQGRVKVQFPNEGSFAGIRWTTASGRRHFAWLRDWQASQHYASPDTAVPVTTYRSPRGIGLRVRDTDVAPPHTSLFVRRFAVHRAAGSPVVSASVVYFENFNPIASHIPLLPIADWCVSKLSDGSALYRSRRQAIVNSWSGTDDATGSPATIAVAFGFAGHTAAHQVGEDGYDQAATPGGPPDAYDQAPHGLGGADSATGQTTGAMEQRLRFGRDGTAVARMTIAAGHTEGAAMQHLTHGRRVSFARRMGAERRDWHRFLSRRVIPAHGGRRLIDVAKRSLISLRLARAPDTGAVVASVNTQGPYGEDWIRDGAFINKLLEREGLERWATEHNRFYARIQASPQNPSAVRPPGNWTMAAYSDGVDGAPIPWEIDETGLGAWTLYEHSTKLRGGAAKRYLASVYPAIRRAADFMAACQDPTTGLQCVANEDDSVTPSQSLHGAGPVLLGLRSAVAAAKDLGDHSADVALWKQREGGLADAIQALYDPASRSYKPGTQAGNSYNVTYGDGGWLLWPVRLLPYSNPRMIGEAHAVAAAMKKSLAAERGQYEAKALLGLSYAWRPFTSAHRRLLDHTLRYMARKLTTRTGLFGESWERRPNNQPFPVQDMPHVWEHSLFLMAALRVEGAQPYRFSPTGR